MSNRRRGVGRRVSWLVALVLFATPCQLMAQTQAPAQAREVGPSASTRAMLPFYVSYAVLQGLDAHSTMRALDRGAVEANPLMKGVASQPAALMAVKVGAGAATIYLSHKLSKRSKTGALVLMAAVNSMSAMIVAHNYRTVK